MWISCDSKLKNNFSSLWAQGPRGPEKHPSPSGLLLVFPARVANRRLSSGIQVMTTFLDFFLRVVPYKKDCSMPGSPPVKNFPFIMNILFRDTVITFAGSRLNPSQNIIHSQERVKWYRCTSFVSTIQQHFFLKLFCVYCVLKNTP